MNYDLLEKINGSCSSLNRNPTSLPPSLSSNRDTCISSLQLSPLADALIQIDLQEQLGFSDLIKGTSTVQGFFAHPCQQPTSE